MLNKLQASAKLYLLVFIMSVFIIGLGVFGIIEMRTMNENTKTLYADRMLPIEQLTTIRYSYLVGIIATAEQVQTHRLSFKDARKQIEETQKNIAANWQAYLHTYLTAEEKQLTSEAPPLMNASNEIIEKLKVILGKEDRNALNDIINTTFYPTINPVIVKMNELVNLQIKVGEQVYKINAQVYSNGLKKFALLVLLSLIIAIPFCYFLVRNVKHLIENLHDRNIKIVRDEKKYRALIEHAGDAIFILDKDTTIIDANEYASRLTGYSREELLGMKVSEFISPEEVEKQVLFFELIKKNMAPLSERRLRRKDGSMVDTEINARLLEDEGYISIVRDITERKRTEEILLESEGKYRSIFENVQDVFYQSSLEGTVLEVSPSIKAQTGFSREEMIGSQVANIYYDPNDREKMIRLLKAKGELTDYELRFKSGTGGMVYVSLNARLITDFDGNPTHIDGVFRNISERKKMEEELVARKEQLTLFIEYSPASLAMFDNDMRYIAVSRRWMNDNNMGKENLIGRNHYDVFPNVPQHWKDAHKRCLRGAIEKNEEDVFTRADGSKDWIRWEIRPWYKATGEIGGIIMFTEVITERKKATELFKHQFENSPDIILIINREFIIESMNRTLKGGPPVQEMIGVNAIEVLPDESREITRNAVIKCFETGENQEVEGALRFGNWGRTRFVPINYTDGAITHIMVISTDITQRKKAEEKIIQSEARLKEAQAIAHTGNWEIDILTDTHTWSDESYKILGITRGEVEPSIEALLSFIHPNDHSEAQEEISSTFNTLSSSATDFRFIRKDGALRYAHIEWRFEFNKDNQPIRLYGIIQDITERRKAEETIKQSEANYRQLFDLSPAPMWVLDGDTYKFAQVNQACIDHYGYSEEEFAQMTIADIIPQNSQTEIKNTVENQNLFNEVFIGSRRHIKKSGEILDIETSGIPVVLNGKKQILVVAIDVTEKNLYEQKLTRAAIKAQEDERYEIGGELHDNVCQILATSVMFLGMVKKDDMPIASKEYFEQTNHYIELASQEIRNLSHRLAPAFFDNSTLEDAFINLLSTFNIEDKYKIALDFSEQAKNYSLSRDLQLNLYRILQEQLRNIVKHAHATNVYVGVIIHKEKLQMNISDNGIGFNLEGGKGGIGFANMNRRVELFSGNFTVNSSLGHGCEITIEVPLASN